jgi:hypothetical protein
VEGTALRIAVQLVVDIDQSPGIHYEVGGVEDPLGGETLAVLFSGELVVGRADHRLAPEARDRVLVQDCTQGTR